MVNKKLSRTLLVTIIFTLSLVVIANAGSVYVIPDHHGTNIFAYNMNPDGSMAFQMALPAVGNSPSGVTLDENSKIILITFEFSSNIQLIDGATLTPMTTLPAGVGNLAGIDVDEANSIVYSIRKASNLVYAYDWNPAGPTLTLRSGFPKSLPGCGAVYGLAYDDDNGELWVADTSTGWARSYSTTTWTQTGGYAPTHRPVDIDIDKLRDIVYTVSGGSGGGTGATSPYLCKYDISASTETVENMGNEGVGVSVDDATGYVYVTFSPYAPGPGAVVAWDPSVSPMVQVDYITANIGSPAGIYAGGGFIPAVSVIKTGPAAASSGATITYTLTYTCTQGPASNVVLTDSLDPGLTYVSASTTPDSIVGQVLTWNIGTLATGQTAAITVDATVTAPPGTIMNNFATIVSDQTPPQTDVQTTVVRIDQVIPEVPLGSIGTLITMISAFLLKRKKY